MDTRIGPPAPPASDVSVGVGMSGLAGLLVWLLICRGWPDIVAVLGLPGPAERLAGPQAALATLLFTGGPMIAWSVLVDKVHRRASTGIDWNRRRKLAEVIDISVTKLAGLWATWALIAFVYCIARWYWRGQYLFAMEVLGMAAVPMFLLSVPYVLWLDRVLINPRDGTWHFGAMLIGREPCDREQVWHHLRAWAVKGFFCAFMISILPPGFAGIVRLDPGLVASNPIEISRWLTELLLLIDVQIAMVGYLVTMRPFDAHIRSANPYLGGWVSALICYPPFILMGGGGVLDYHPQTADWAYWLEGMPPAVLWLWGAWLVFLTAVYAWATVAFGLRFSNLTYRGVLTNGPYRYTRHPAYLAKNAYWWFATMPFLVTSHSLTDAVRNTVLLGLVSAVYYWRAKTEEQHLLAEDPKYREYHAWMADNALITRGLGKFASMLQPRGGQPRPTS
ncbi:MAG: isoprenylcysteine carboxylmethyltransferase family protein [Novosphingobium sp.]